MLIGDGAPVAAPRARPPATAHSRAAAVQAEGSHLACTRERVGAGGERRRKPLVLDLAGCAASWASGRRARHSLRKIMLLALLNVMPQHLRAAGGGGRCRGWRDSCAGAARPVTPSYKSVFQGHAPAGAACKRMVAHGAAYGEGRAASKPRAHGVRRPTILPSNGKTSHHAAPPRPRPSRWQPATPTRCRRHTALLAGCGWARCRATNPPQTAPAAPDHSPGASIGRHARNAASPRPRTHLSGRAGSRHSGCAGWSDEQTAV